MLGVTALAFMGLPLLLPAAVLVDVVRLRLKLPTLRVYLFLLQYGFNDSVEIVLAPIYWLLAGFGRGLGSSTSIDRHQRLQSWSVRLLVRRADQLLGIKLSLADADRLELTPGPVIAISRHASLFDASLPGLLCQQEGLAVRGVIMAELLADPGFDLIYNRTGSVFIPRDRGSDAVAAIAAMASSASDNTAYVLFPEGRLFRPKVRDRLLGRLSESDPERADRLSGLTGVLPPRPGGLQALLETLPEADVVIIDHSGLDRYQGVADLLTLTPAREPVNVSITRIPRSEVPTDAKAQVRWLDDRWLEIDQRLSAQQLTE